MNIIFEFNPKNIIISYLKEKYDLNDNQIEGLISYPSLLSKINQPGITRGINLLRLLSLVDTEESDKFARRKLAIINYIVLTHEYTMFKWAPNMFGSIVTGTLREDIFNAYKIHYHLPSHINVKNIEVHLFASTHALYPILLKHPLEERENIVNRLKGVRDRIGYLLETYDFDVLDNNDLLEEIPNLINLPTPIYSSSSSNPDSGKLKKHYSSFSSSHDPDRVMEIINVGIKRTEAIKASSSTSMGNN